MGTKDARGPIVFKFDIPRPSAGDPLYALEKLASVVWTLASHPGNIRDRLWDAQRDLVAISDRDIPNELRPMWLELKADMRKLKPTGHGQTAYGATISRSRLKTCEGFATRILELHDRIWGYTSEPHD